MKESKIEKLLGFLGKPYKDLVAEKIVTDTGLKEIYSGSDRLYILPEEGLELDFWADSKVFIELFITLKKTTPATTSYKGELPEIFFPGMDQEMVIDLFGEPASSRGPVRLPHPIGQTGGWASYIYDDELFPGVELQFQYTADMQVKTVVFSLKK